MSRGEPGARGASLRGFQGAGRGRPRLRTPASPASSGLSIPRGASPGVLAGAGPRRPVPAAGRPAGPRPGAGAPRPAARWAVAAPESPAPGHAAAARGPAEPSARRRGSGREESSHYRRHSRAPVPRPLWRPKGGLEPVSPVAAGRKCVTGKGRNLRVLGRPKHFRS